MALKMVIGMVYLQIIGVLITIPITAAFAKNKFTSGYFIYNDTSFTIQGAYLKELKKYPNIQIADLPVPDGVEFIGSIQYSALAGRPLLADIYKPVAKAKNYPVVLLVHGGGWKSGNKSQMAAIARELARQGFVAVSPEYRLSDEAKYPAALNDLQSAITWLKMTSSNYSIDTARIAVLGVSAGGQLATLLATIGGSKVQAVVNIDGILAFHHPESQEGNSAAEWLGGTYSQIPQIWAEASPLTHAGPQTPPILFINSQHPRFRAGRDEMIKRISDFGIYSEFYTIESTPHTFWLFHPWFEPVIGRTVAFLNKVFSYDGKGNDKSR